MARRPHWLWWLAGGAAVLAFAGPAIASRHNPPAERAKLQALADKWAPFFGAHPADMMAIGKLESQWWPDTVNYTLRSIPQGGAWGPWQMTRTTATDYAARLARHKDPAVRAIAARWKGNGNALTSDMELAAVLSAAMLGNLTREFKTGDLIAAAYQQGPAKIRAVLRAGQPIPAALPPHGREYVAMFRVARKAVG